MADQFDVIEVGGKGRRRWVGIVVLLALLAVPAVSLLASRDPVPEAPAPAPSGQVGQLATINSAPNLLHAESRAKGGDEIIDVVFPHGARAEVRYPAELRLDELGSRPFQGVWIDGEMAQYRQFTTPYGGDYEVTRGGKPLRNFTDDVTLWPRPPGGGATGQVLMFAFGPWRLAMYDRPAGLRFEDRMALAQRVRGKVTADGYLVLSGSGPVRLAKPGEGRRDDQIGPQLWFGGGWGDMLAIVPYPGCRRPSIPTAMGARGRFARARCRGDFMIAASGAEAFVKAAVTKIRIMPR